MISEYELELLLDIIDDAISLNNTHFNSVPEHYYSLRNRIHSLLANKRRADS